MARGLAFEIRLERARTTKDIDVRLTGSSGALLERLQTAGRKDLDGRAGTWQPAEWTWSSREKEL
jgi:hypothetical protein